MLSGSRTQISSFYVTKVWFKDREKGSRDSRRNFFFVPNPLLVSLQTTYICAEHANLFDIESSRVKKKFFCFSERESFSVFRHSIAVVNYCRVVCEANIKLLLMIYWVGFNVRLPCLPCNLQYFNNKPQKWFYIQKRDRRRKGENMQLLRFGKINGKMTVFEAEIMGSKVRDYEFIGRLKCDERILMFELVNFQLIIVFILFICR